MKGSFEQGTSRPNIWSHAFPVKRHIDIEGARACAKVVVEDSPYSHVAALTVSG
jgi:hypothetical protein